MPAKKKWKAVVNPRFGKNFNATYEGKTYVPGEVYEFAERPRYFVDYLGSPTAVFVGEDKKPLPPETTPAEVVDG